MCVVSGRRLPGTGAAGLRGWGVLALKEIPKPKEIPKSKVIPKPNSSPSPSPIALTRLEVDRATAAR